MKNSILLLSLLLLTKLLSAQYAVFPDYGSIEFEKRINMFAILQKKVAASSNPSAPSAFEEYKKTHPQFAVLKSTLTFQKDQSLFVPQQTIADPSLAFFGEDPLTAQLNTVHINTTTHTRTVQKKMLGDDYLVKDTLPSIKWKITDEIRDIAGYSCRRANGILQDSIYVVAFYTTEIHVSTGPESFNGLPGMILGVALPHLHVSWFATKVTTAGTGLQPVTPPKTGKEKTASELRTMLKKTLEGLSGYDGKVIDYYFM